MKNRERWRPTKVVKRGDRFQPSSDSNDLSVSSRLVASRQIEQYRRVLQGHARGRLLDLGCGQVPYYELYNNLVDEVVCIDWENSRNKSQFPDSFMDLNKPLTIESESFDTVLLTDVLEHIYRPNQLLGEIARVLRQGGHVIIGVPFFYWVHESPFDFHRYTEFALRQMCSDSSLKIVSIDAYGGAPEIVVDVIGKCIDSAGWHLACAVYSSLLHQILSLWPLRRLSERTAKAFPLGYTLMAQKT